MEVAFFLVLDMKVTFLEHLSIVGKEGSLGSIASDDWFGVKHSVLERER